MKTVIAEFQIALVAEALPPASKLAVMTCSLLSANGFRLIRGSGSDKSKFNR